MKKDAEEKKLPPIYRGKWASASKEEVEAMKASGAPYCYRFRVPKVGRGRGGSLRWEGGGDGPPTGGGGLDWVNKGGSRGMGHLGTSLVFPPFCLE